MNWRAFWQGFFDVLGHPATLAFVLVYGTALLLLMHYGVM